MDLQNDTFMSWLEQSKDISQHFTLKSATTFETLQNCLYLSSNWYASYQIVRII